MLKKCSKNPGDISGHRDSQIYTENAREKENINVKEKKNCQQLVNVRPKDDTELSFFFNFL